jgi:hypothetical protein
MNLRIIYQSNILSFPPDFIIYTSAKVCFSFKNRKNRIKNLIFSCSYKLMNEPRTSDLRLPYHHWEEFGIF